jgi:hypothetical protein
MYPKCILPYAAGYVGILSGYVGIRRDTIEVKCILDNSYRIQRYTRIHVGYT